MFEFISLLNNNDHNSFVNTLSQQWKDGYQIWKTLVETTGRTGHDTIDFLNKKVGLSQVPHDHVDTFISEDHRLLRKVDLPDPLLDEVTRTRSDGQVEIIQLMNIFSDVSFTIDTDEKNENKKLGTLTQQYGTYRIQTSLKDDRTEGQTLSRFNDLPMRYLWFNDKNGYRDNYLFSGEGGEVFWFTAKPGYLNLNFLPNDSEEV